MCFVSFNGEDFPNFRTYNQERSLQNLLMCPIFANPNFGRHLTPEEYNLFNDGSWRIRLVK